MRVSHTSLAVAAVLFVTACGTNSPEIVAPVNGSVNIATDPSKDGTGQMGSGNFISPAGEGIGQIGSGNAIATDSTSTPSSTPAGGIGQIGSGN